MSEVGRLSDAQEDEISELAADMVDLMRGKTGTVAAEACLRIAVVLWTMGDVTQEQVLNVVKSHLDHLPRAH